jgi:hypothetical protein
MSDLEDALDLRRTTMDYTRTEEENEQLDRLIYGAARLVANPNIRAAQIARLDGESTTDIVAAALTPGDTE